MLEQTTVFNGKGWVALLPKFWFNPVSSVTQLELAFGDRGFNPSRCTFVINASSPLQVEGWLDASVDGGWRSVLAADDTRDDADVLVNLIRRFHVFDHSVDRSTIRSCRSVLQQTASDVSAESVD